MPDFLAAQPHGRFREVFPDLYMVTGSFRFAPALSISRNMTVVRQRGELTVINSVRLSPAGEAELERLGTVKHVIRIGSFHGADDPWFVHRFGATLWAPPGMIAGGKEELRPGHCPIDRAKVFLFEHAKAPEAAIVVEQDGGVLVPCDSYQNWTDFDGCSFLGGLMMRAMGFGPTLVGGPWVKQVGREVRADFDRLQELDFLNLVPAHGTVIEKIAKEGLRAAIAHRFGL